MNMSLAKGAALTSSMFLVGGYLAYAGGELHFGKAPPATVQYVQVQSPAEGAPLMTSSKYGVLASPSLTPATETAPMALLPGSKSFVSVTSGGTLTLVGEALPADGVTPPTTQQMLMTSSKSGVIISPLTTQSVPATIIGGSKSLVPVVPTKTVNAPTTLPTVIMPSSKVSAPLISMPATVPTVIMPSSKVLAPLIVTPARPPTVILDGSETKVPPIGPPQAVGVSQSATQPATQAAAREGGK